MWSTSATIHSLSTNTVSYAKDLFFVRPLGNWNPGENKSDLDDLHRRIRLFSHFNDNADIAENLFDKYDLNFKSVEAFEHYKLKLKSTFNPQGAPTVEAMILANETNLNKRPSYKAKGSNMTQGEKKAIKELLDLQTTGNIIIKPCDKGGAIVRLNWDDYLKAGQ